MYKLCIDEENTPKFIKYKCGNCGYETEIPYSLIKDLIKDNKYPIFECSKCDSVIKHD